MVHGLCSRHGATIYMFTSGQLSEPLRVETSEEADAALRVSDARAFWIAAVRETIEEVGLVVGEHSQDLVGHRHALDRGEVRLSELVATSGRPLDLSDLHAISRWVTPMPSPRRYDTYFFVARAPRGSEPSADGSEAVEARWTTPGGALEGWREGELTMMRPALMVSLNS